MHCFVMGLLKWLAIRVVLFLALHKNPRIKADSDLISASLVSVTIYMYQNSSPGVRMTMREERQSRNADFKNCGEAATTTFSGGAAVAP